MWGTRQNHSPQLPESPVRLRVRLAGVSGRGAGSFAEGDIADVEGALDGLVAFDEVFDGEELDAGVFVPAARRPGECRSRLRRLRGASRGWVWRRRCRHRENLLQGGVRPPFESKLCVRGNAIRRRDDMKKLGTALLLLLSFALATPAQLPTGSAGAAPTSVASAAAPPNPEPIVTQFKKTVVLVETDCVVPDGAGATKIVLTRNRFSSDAS